MQWLCGAEVVGEAQAVAAALARSHAIGVDLWRVDDWTALAHEGASCERQWRRGERPWVGSRFETLMTPTQGPILAITQQARAVPEMLRAFVPAGRRYLSLCDHDVGAILEAALRLDAEIDTAWAKLSAI